MGTLVASLSVAAKFDRNLLFCSPGAVDASSSEAGIDISSGTLLVCSLRTVIASSSGIIDR